MQQEYDTSSLGLVRDTEDKTLSILVAILGARMHYSVPMVLDQMGLLDSFHTDIFLKSNGAGKSLGGYFRNSSTRSLRRLAGRTEGGLSSQKVHTYLLLGILYITYLRMVSSTRRKEWGYAHFGSWFASSVSKSTLHGVDAVYACNGAALELFELVKLKNISCILEQVSAPYSFMNRLFEEEYSLWPGWEHQIKQDRYPPLGNREEKEWSLADGIIAGSQFVVDGLVNNNVRSGKCHVVPYAVDIWKYHWLENKPHENPYSLHVLFLGTVSLRKGIQYLVGALDQLNSRNFTVKVAGKIELRPEAIQKVGNRCELLGLVPRSDIVRLLDWADVLVLPTVCEGSAVVTYEALASGVPVITTPNAGSVVRDGVDGYVVPLRDAEALAERIEKLSVTPGLREDMSREARKFAQENLSWEAYAKRLIRACSDIIEGKTRL